MIQPGRKGSTALSVASVTELHPIPDPPKSLEPAQADVWRLVMGQVAGDLIAPEAYPLLVEYCRAVVTADQIAEQLAKFDPAWLAEDDGLKRFDKLTGMQARAQGVVSTLSGKLRISPSSRVHKDTAGRMGAKGAKRKPWQVDD